MPQIQFESLSSSLRRLPQLIQTIPDIIRDPSANPVQAVILLAMAVVLILILLLSIILIVMKPPTVEEHEYYDYENEEYDESAEGEEGDEEYAHPVPREPRAAQDLRARFVMLSLGIIVLALVWVVTGLTTGNSRTCSSCHTNTSHMAAVHDPHASVDCVACHESGGPVARATVNVATRVEHFLLAQFNPDAAKLYGTPAASDACMQCHGSQIAGTTTDEGLQVRTSHKEFVSAGSQCVDCHTLNSGMVNATTIGMSPCLRCHDGKYAKAVCTTCHIGDPSRSITPSVTRNQMASMQVPNPQCDGCHFDMTKCTACHGLQMPHTQEFMAYGHARVAAQNIWFGNGRLCAKCHYPEHRDCTQAGCHTMTPAMGHGNPGWARLHAFTSWSKGPATACSCHHWNAYDHNGMIFCQICHPTKPKNAVP